MKHSSFSAIVVFVYSLFFSCISKQNEKEWKTLFTGNDMSGWDTYLGPAYDTVKQRFDSLTTLGLNNDPDKVFQVVEEEGAAAIRISGSHNGGISTKEEFENYHLSLQFKWGTQKYHPRKDRKRDSGLLYHAVGKHGADFGFWMTSQEFQIQEGDCGDYWGVAGGIMDIPATGNAPENYRYQVNAPLLTFSGTSNYGRRCIKDSDNEQPTGEWNLIEIYCVGDSSVHLINGKVNMILYNSRKVDGGKETPLTKGKIQLQSEGAEVFYRNIKIQQITNLPQGVLEK